MRQALGRKVNPKALHGQKLSPPNGGNGGGERGRLRDFTLSPPPFKEKSVLLHIRGGLSGSIDARLGVFPQQGGVTLGSCFKTEPRP
jgi:hypothetical protein